MPTRVQKLHLVGFTTDQKGLILSVRRGARSGSYHLPVDAELQAAVEELRARQAETEAEQALPEPEDPTPRVESALSVREIQARLRQGRTVADVAKAAGVDASWVERFAPPVYAEQAQVIDRVRRARLLRPRLGPSARPIGEAVRQHLAERGVAATPDEETARWTTRQMADGRWVVRYRFRSRGKDRTLRYEVSPDGEISAGDRSSAQLGYVAPDGPPPRPAAPRRAPADEAPPAPKRATVTTGFRPDANAGPATSRAAKERERATVAMGRAAAKAAVEAERAAARKAKEREAAQAKAAREAAREAARIERERQAAERAKAAAAAKKEAARQRAAAERARKKAAKQAAAKRKAEAARAKREAAKRRAAQARRAEAALLAAERAEAARKRAAAKQATAVRAKPAAQGKKAAATKAQGKKGTATKTQRKKGTATKARAGTDLSRKTPVRKAPVRKAAGQRAPAEPAPSPTRPTERAGEAPAPTPASGPRPLVTVDDPVGDAAPELRPRFRPGAAEPAGSGADATGNGLASMRPLDRPRRTRPLRAT